MKAGVLLTSAAACLSLMFALVLQPVLAQDPEAEDTPPLYENLGSFSRDVTTDSERAQAYFDQGMRLAYSFARSEAARSFRKARQIDPDCAMCYWGEAWALGPYQNNPGACHIYIHVIEAWKPERAEDCADLLAESVPGVAHMQHMPSHIYVQVGRYGDAVRSNLDAVRVARAAEYNEGFVVYPGHNLAMLVFTAWLDGQSGVALSAARDVADAMHGGTYTYDLQLARFGRWDELLARSSEPELALQKAFTHFARGLAHLRTGSPDTASEHLETIRMIRKETPEDATYTFFGFSQRDLLGIAENILAGEILAAERQYEEAEAALRQAIALEDGLPYSEPEPWPIPARHVLGTALLEADQPEKAETVYRESLEVHPDNGWSLKGLAQSLEAQGKKTQARETERAFDRAWRRADVWFPASRF